MNSDYDDSIRKMLAWRRVQRYVLWIGLAWPLMFFLPISQALVLYLWLPLVITFLVCHCFRTHYRQKAEELSDD